MNLKEIVPMVIVVLVVFVALASENLVGETTEAIEVRRVAVQPVSYSPSESPSPSDSLVEAPQILEAPKQVQRRRIEVEARRLNPDHRIQLAAMDAIATMPDLCGRIGVETKDSVVRLSGWTMTSGQSLRAEKAAGRVKGVRYVVNEIRPRVGPITS